MESIRKNCKVFDIDMNYYEKGKGEAVIILHGNGMDSRKHKKMIEEFSKKFNVIALDTRAHGLTTVGSKKMSVENFADDVIEFCKINRLKKINLIGYSDGANISMWIAKKKPEIIDRMVLISGNYKGTGVCWWFRILLIVCKILLLPIGIISEKVRLRNNLIDVMLHDIGVSEKDLEKIQNRTLVMYAGIDFITKKHTENIADKIKGAKIKRIVWSHHLDIFKKRETIQIIEKFLEKPQI